MTNDPFANYKDSPIAPSTNCFAVQPSDDEGLPVPTKALYVGQAGDVMLLALRSASPVLFANVPAGTILDVRAQAVHATGTTASDIVGLA
ncbi:spike base protein, RCAP_Rcc01079 family [Alteraurantiacibacter aquimixticola]|uniref:Uncharacterized protein n=1 Tax=Alteraurantiacibacter aquimixticola TaxID=2489173 RepID=A0A4T3F2Z3_9SPHN|nr:hypothetical protein [Alteraurantiacibacter aquimixticola]TIX48980.1 hypothetical protein E5222_14700 [Alteraurantiacibacter aquimixticola]